jgi:DNA-binding phage protein
MRKSEPRRKLPPIIRVRIFEQEHVVALLRAEIERSGGQSAWARKTGADRSLLSRILKGHWHPIKAIIEALGLRLAAVSDDRPAKKGSR